MSQTEPRTLPDVGGTGEPRPTGGSGLRGLASRISPKAWFLLVLLAVFAVYTDMAFDLEWRTAAGRIGPGYFPRIIGIIGVALTAVVLVMDLRSDVHEVADLEDEVGDAAEHLGRHPRTLVVFVAACAGFIVLLTYLGAMVATAVFLLGTLLMLDPRHRVRAVVIALAVPVLLHFGFDVGLNAGLPGGIFDSY